MQLLEKLWRMEENKETLNLQQQKGEETIQYQNQNFFTENSLVIEMKKLKY